MVPNILMADKKILGGVPDFIHIYVILSHQVSIRQVLSLGKPLVPQPFQGL